MASLQILLGGGGVGVGNCRLSPLLAPAPSRNSALAMNLKKGITRNMALRGFRRRSSTAVTIQRRFSQISASLDLTEDNVKLVLQDARTEFAHIFDTSMGMTGVAELAEVDGPFVKISLRGRFWHERSLILARIGNYLKQRIPEILEVDIEDEQQLDDSPENF